VVSVVLREPTRSRFADRIFLFCICFLFVIRRFINYNRHLPLKIYGTELNLPIHSFVAFLMGITLVENLNLLPSYLLFSIAWFLMATYEASMKHPSPWAGSIRLKHMYMNTIYGKVRAFPESIAEYENEAAVRAYDEELKRRHEEEQEILKQRQETARQLTELYGQGATEPDDLSAIRVTKKDVNIVNDMISSVNPLSTSLLPIQQMLGHTASYIRILHSILSWDESIYAFLILNASIAVGIIFLFVPWGWIARWFFRLTIWIFLGRKSPICMFLVLLMLVLFLLFFYGGIPNFGDIDTSLSIYSYNPFLSIPK
jgi:hypothetical protein